MPLLDRLRDMSRTRSLSPDRPNVDGADLRVDTRHAEPDGTPLSQGCLERMGIVAAVSR